MLRRVDDCNGSFACMADAETGMIEHKNRGARTTTCIPIGGEYTIEKDGTVTKLRRISIGKFEITSYKIAS